MSLKEWWNKKKKLTLKKKSFNKIDKIITLFKKKYLFKG